MPLVLVAGDTMPSLEFALTRRGPDGRDLPEDLTPAIEATAHVDREGRDPLDRALIFLDREAGIVRLDWQGGDLDATPAGGVAQYRIEVTVDGETVPDPFELHVRPRLPVAGPPDEEAPA